MIREAYASGYATMFEKVAEDNGSRSVDEYQARRDLPPWLVPALTTGVGALYGGAMGHAMKGKGLAGAAIGGAAGLGVGALGEAIDRYWAKKVVDAHYSRKKKLKERF